MNNDHIIPAVEKAVLLLGRLGKSKRGATQAELAKELEITPSTCYRIIQTLLRHDWIAKLPGNRYDLSGGMLSAAMKLAGRASRFEAAQPLLEALSAKIGLSCKLSIRQGAEQMTILRAESPRPMAVSGKVGSRFPLVEGSVGAALLRADAEADILALAAECREDVPERQRPELTLRRIAEIKAKGFCLNSGASRWKVAAMSVPVMEVDGQVAAALTLLGFDDDFPADKLDALAAQATATAADCAKLC